MVNRTRKGKKHKKRHGGNVVGGLLGAIKKALPSYLLYQAVKMQQKKKRGKSRRGGKSRKGGSKSRRGGFWPNCIPNNSPNSQQGCGKGGSKSRRGGTRRRR